MYSEKEGKGFSPGIAKTVLVVLMILFIIGFVWMTSLAFAEQNGKPVYGMFDSSPSVPCASPVGICPQGRVHGTYAFTLDRTIPAEIPQFRESFLTQASARLP